jgi:hypothetical protein
VIAVALAIALSVPSEGPSVKPFDKYDYSILSALLAVSVFDVMSTRALLGKQACQANKDAICVCHEWQEANPMLGIRPDAFRLWTTFVLAQTIVFGVAHALPDPWRKIFEMSVFSLETTNVGLNVRLARHEGLSWKDTFTIKF